MTLPGVDVPLPYPDAPAAGIPAVIDLTAPPGEMPAVDDTPPEPVTEPEPLPLPGSYDALATGCLCPAVQTANAFGGTTVVVGGCPVHAPAQVTL